MSEETLDSLREKLAAKESEVASLIEANGILHDEVSQLRNSNRILRRVHSALRSAITSLRKQIDNAAFNDDMFKRFCQGEFDATGVPVTEGGLPEGEGTVEATV